MSGKNDFTCTLKFEVIVYAPCIIYAYANQPGNVKRGMELNFLHYYLLPHGTPRKNYCFMHASVVLTLVSGLYENQVLYI